MVCQHGGLTLVRYNDLQDNTAKFLSKICSEVAIEPPLQLLSGEIITPKTAIDRADIYTSIPAVYCHHELQKKREYGEWIREIELASFTPLVFAQLVEWERKL